MPKTVDNLIAHVDPAWELGRDAQGNVVVLADNLEVLSRMDDGAVRLVYVDPPFNTGVRQKRVTVKAKRASPVPSSEDLLHATPRGKHGKAQAKAYEGFGGRPYEREQIAGSSYADDFEDYVGFLRPRLEQAHRVLGADASLFFHVDWREAARCRLLLEEVFGGPEHCINEIIWAYDFGARSKSRWPAKHDNIYWFAKDPKNYVFDLDAADRIPYMAPGLVSEEKARRGKTPTDTWWHTIVPTNSKEKTGYPTQKPLGIVERIVKVHSAPGDLVMDFFAGSGTTGDAAARNDRRYLLVDANPEAMDVMRTRLALVSDQ